METKQQWVSAPQRQTYLYRATRDWSAFKLFCMFVLAVYLHVHANISVYLEHFNKQVQALVLNKMAASSWWFISEVPECTQCKFEGGVHHALSSLLTHNVEQLLEGGGNIFAMKMCLFFGKLVKVEENRAKMTILPSLWTALLPAEPSALWTTRKKANILQFKNNLNKRAHVILIQHNIYLSSQYGNDSHSHPLHVLVFMVAEPLHH